MAVHWHWGGARAAPLTPPIGACSVLGYCSFDDVEHRKHVWTRQRLKQASKHGLLALSRAWLVPVGVP
eukprot:14950519-Heterocapsa_arctica.AAC.1